MYTTPQPIGLRYWMNTKRLHRNGADCQQPSQQLSPSTIAGAKTPKTKGRWTEVDCVVSPSILTPLQRGLELK